MVESTSGPLTRPPQHDGSAAAAPHKTTDDAAIIAVLARRYCLAEAQRIHRLATTTHKGRVDSTAYSRWVDAAKEARNAE